MAIVLIIEPNKLLAEQYKTYLETQGHTVVCASRAQDAINQADNAKPDIVISELLLTSHSGIEFLHEFRSYVEWLDIPVIILSRLTRESLQASDDVLRSLGVTSYLYKPETTLKRLNMKIDSVLSSLINTK
jgi:DNA-binding response OmpR family regulator